MHSFVRLCIHGEISCPQGGESPTDPLAHRLGRQPQPLGNLRIVLTGHHTQHEAGGVFFREGPQRGMQQLTQSELVLEMAARRQAPLAPL
jgi:hypothetical protein